MNPAHLHRFSGICRQQVHSVHEGEGHRRVIDIVDCDGQGVRGGQGRDAGDRVLGDVDNRLVRAVGVSVRSQ